MYIVTWPWKEDKSCLPENRELAFGSLKSLVKKMKSNPQLVDKYDAIIEKTTTTWNHRKGDQQ